MIDVSIDFFIARVISFKSQQKHRVKRAKKHDNFQTRVWWNQGGHWVFPIEHLYAYLGLVSPSLLNNWELRYSRNLSRSGLTLKHLIRLPPALLLSVGGNCGNISEMLAVLNKFHNCDKNFRKTRRDMRERHERMERDNSWNVLPYVILDPLSNKERCWGGRGGGGVDGLAFF